MPIKKAAEKHLRQTKVHTIRNKDRKNRLRRLLKTAERAVAAGDQTKTVSGITAAIRGIDKGVKQGILHKNTAARKKSALARKLTALKQATPKQ